MPRSARRSPRWGWWHIPVFATLAIAVFFTAWELVESQYFGDVSSTARRWFYIGRGIFGALCIGLVTGLLVRRHERRIAQLRQAVVQNDKLATIGQIAAGLAHEIGNPLASISSVVQLLQRAGLPETERTRLQLIHGEIARIQAIVRQLTDCARPSPADPTPCDPARILDDAIELAQFDPRARGVRIDRRYPARLPTVLAVRDHLIQVFLNIIYNAMDAMPHGGALTVVGAVRDANVVIDFQDTGVGIPRDQLDRVFTPFFSTKERGHGTGLGLAVTRHLVVQHNGRITLESTQGRGTRVSVELPTIRADSAEAVRHHPDREPAVVRGAGSDV